MNNPSVEPTKKSDFWVSANTLRHLVIFLCVLFFIIVLTLVYFSATGSPQAGLIEVGTFAFIFVSLFLLIMRFFPYISRLFTLVIIIGFGVVAIYANYYFLRIVKEDAPFKRLLVGDLLVNKIAQTIEKGPLAVLSPRRIPDVFPPEIPMPDLSLDQLRGPIATPVKVGLELVLPVPANGPTAMSGITDSVEEYKIGLPRNGDIRTEILGLEFVFLNGHKYMIRDVLDKRSLKLLPVAFLAPLAGEEIVSVVNEYKVALPVRSSGTVITDLRFSHEMPDQELEGIKRRHPLSDLPEAETLVPVMTLGKPLKEGIITIN